MPLASTDPRPPAEGTGSTIGPYRLLRSIGEGGMGSVFLAEQDRPIRRRVALKVIKPGMDTGQVVARFEAERQALALMDHPNIARVLDAGATATGRPFFVMELVHGAPITEYCDQHRLGIRERLELFLPVCRAIQHAHQKGIIHRDIKPSNILVALRDGAPEPKVIDFGVAKAVDRRLAERTPHTEFGVLLGTLEYMSPEQAESQAPDVDTRSDIYSLGVLLYELLAGSTPLERRKLRLVAHSEILRRIREEEPHRPSSRLAESRDALATISERRGVEPARLPRLVRGELDWIAMKALEKDRARRYETANGLARDVRRHLDGDAVEAGPPSTRYRLAKFARRHRAALAAAAACTGLLVAATGFSLGMAVWARQQLARAELAERRALRQQGAAEAAGAEARRHQRSAETAARRALDQHDRAQKRETIAIDAIRRYVDLVRDTPELKHNPALASLRKSLMQEPQGYFQRLRDQLQADSDTTPESLIRLGAACFDLGQLAAEVGNGEDALAAYEQSRQVRAQLARANPADSQLKADLAASLHSIGLRRKDACAMGEAMDAFNQARAIRAHLAADHPDVPQFRSDLAASQHEIGDVQRQLGHLAEALVAYERSLEIREQLVADHPTSIPFGRELAASCNDLGVLHDTLGHAEAAKRSFDRSRALGERLAADHPSVIQLQRDLALGCHNAGVKRRQAGHLGEAMIAYDKAREIRERLVRDNPTVAEFRRELATSCNDSAIVQHLLGHLPEAMASFDRAVAIREQVARENPSATHFQEELAASFHDIGVVQGALGANAAALRSHERALAILEPLLGAHPTIALFRRGVALNCRRIGTLHQVEGRPDAAREFLERADEAEDRLDAGNPEKAALDARLADVLDGKPPRDGAERVALAARAYGRRWYAASARLYADAFECDPALLDDRWARVAYDAACSAMLVGCGRDRHQPTLDTEALARFRRLGLDWLRVELAGRSGQLVADPVESRAIVRLNLKHWKQDADLAGVRDEEELARWPEPEQAEYRKFWAEVDRLLLQVALGP